jgi:hypothetical protein
MALQARAWTLAAFYDFLILYIVDRIPSVGDQPISRPLPKHKVTQTQNKPTLTSMLRVGSEPKTPVIERAKTAHASDRVAATIHPSSKLHFL